MSPFDDILDAVIAQGCVVDWRLSDSESWQSFLIGHIGFALSSDMTVTISEHGIFHGIVI